MKIMIPLLFAIFSAQAVAADSCCSKSKTSIQPLALPDQSLFHLESQWTDQNGEAFKLIDLKGEPALVTMFFTSCGYACPILIEDMKAILAALSGAQKKLKCVLLSFDAKRDFPPTLKTFAEQRQLPAPQWTLLHAPDSTVMETSAVLGIRYRKDKVGNFAHSNIITLLNAEGEIVYQLNGLDSDPASLIDAITEL